jgi:hypothetical protein
MRNTLRGNLVNAQAYFPGFLAARPSNTLLGYKIVPAEASMIFQVTVQDQKITNFMSNGYFQASNGLRVATDDFPEFKETKNIIFLRGTGRTKTNDNVDVTRFISNTARDSKIEMVDEALKELVDYVKSLDYYSAIPRRTSGLDDFFNPSGNVRVVFLG